MDANLLAGLLGAKGGGKGGGGMDLSSMFGGGGNQIWENPMVSNLVFHPSKIEPEYMGTSSGPMRDGVFDVSGGDKVSYRLYLPAGPAKVVVYFWHGNAEHCTSADGHKDHFHSCDAAILSLDYRGYSWGTGQPSLTKLCGDAEACFAASHALLEEAGCSGAKRVVMGRSIGATCAVHIAAKRADKIHGLVVDSGLMAMKGVPMVKSMGPMVMGSPEAFESLAEPFDTLGKLSAISCPALVMHGKRDEIVPFSQGVECHSRLASSDKVLKEWENAGHNDVTLAYESQWAQAIAELIEKAFSFTEPFPSGILVEAHSLSAAALNGLQGRILGPQGERYRVGFPDPTGEKAIKPANLKVIEEDVPLSPESFVIGSTVEAHSLSKQDLNGLRGKVLGPQGDRVNIEFPDPHGQKALKPTNIRLVKD